MTGRHLPTLTVIPRVPMFSDYIIYVDESGDHSLTHVDPNYPVFVVAFCIFKKCDYHQAVAKLLDLKFRTWGHDMAVFHERDIRKRLGDFAFLNDPMQRAQFLGEVSAFVQNSPFTLIAAVIRKRRLITKYAQPENPYDIALTFCLERSFMYLRALAQVGATTHVIVESRGKKEDNDLELAFRRACAGHTQLAEALPFEIRFSDKRANSTGMQLADLVARPIGQEIIQPGSQVRIYPIIQAKFRRNGQGKIDGWGLKVFP